MREYIFKNKLWLFITVLVRVTGATMQVYIALIVQHIVDSAVEHKMDTFTKWILFSLFYFALMGLVDYLTGTTQGIYLKRTLIKLKEDVFRGIMSKDYKHFNENNTADYISNLTNDMNLVENNYIVPYLMMVGDIAIFVVTTGVLLWMNAWVTLALFVTAALMLIIPAAFGKPTQIRQDKVSLSLGVFTTKIKDIFQGYEVVRSYNMETSITKEFNSENINLEVNKFKSAHIRAISNAVSLILGVTTQIAGIALAGYFVIKGQTTAGGLLAIVQLANGIQGPIMWVIQKVTVIKGMQGINKKLQDTIEEGKTTKSGTVVNEFNKKLVLEEVSYSYNAESNVLNNVSYTFDKNKKYAIVGRSGCGKSTLLKLMLGYYDNYKGNIKVDDKEIGILDITSLNRMISIIHQNVYMFDKSIEENILLDKKFNEDEVKKALALSGVQNFLEVLPSGIKTGVGENGKNLSGGQKQRVAIARALIQNTPILMLDEGTSALDFQTAYEIENTLLNIEDLTVITITHKLSDLLLSKYDEILFMDKGEIIEKGSFEELIRKEGDFYKLYSLSGDDETNIISNAI